MPPEIEELVIANNPLRYSTYKFLREIFESEKLKSDTNGEADPYANPCSAFVEKITTWLIGAGIVFRTTAANMPILEEYYKELQENSDGDIFWRRASQICSAFGDAWVQALVSPDVNYGSGGIKFVVHEPDAIFPVYKQTASGWYLEKLGLVWQTLDAATKKTTLNLEIWDSKKVQVFSATRSLTFQFLTGLTPVVEIASFGTKQVYDNPYGEIPFVHIRNTVHLNHPFGKSDIHELWITAKELTKSLKSYNDNVDYHSSPMIALFGAAWGDVERTADELVGNLPDKARIQVVEIQQIYQQIISYMGMMEKYMGFFAIPISMFHLDPAALSGDTSAAALRLRFLPIFEYIAKKSPNYKLGFSKVMELGLRILDTEYNFDLKRFSSPPDYLVQKLSEFKTYDNKSLAPDFVDKMLKLRTHPFYYTTVDFNDFLPRNRTLDLADIVVELTNNLESTKGALERLGVSDVTKKLEEIKQSMQEKLAYTAELAVAQAAGNTPATLDANGNPVNNSSPPKNSTQIEQNTGQSAVRTEQQRAMKGKGQI